MSRAPAAELVRLVDGREVSSASEEWRHECEARAIYALPGLYERRPCLESIEHRHGKPAADALRQTMKALWEARQAEKGKTA